LDDFVTGGPAPKALEVFNVRELIEWLIGVEKMAADVYDAAAERLVDDAEFASLARRLASEEREHHKLMKLAKDLLADVKADEPTITMSPEARRQADKYLTLYRNKVAADGFSASMLVDLMVAIEFSEWNDAFLLVCNVLKDSHPGFAAIGPKLQQHKRSVERFIESRTEYRNYLDRVQRLKNVWHEKILVVDDDASILDTVSAILADEGKIDKAVNGAEALARLTENYYATIITDVDMPVMDGIELYRTAVELYPNIRRRFLFFTGSVDEDRQTYFDTEGVSYIQKPSGIKTLRKAVAKILDGTSSG